MSNLPGHSVPYEFEQPDHILYHTYDSSTGSNQSRQYNKQKNCEVGEWWTDLLIEAIDQIPLHEKMGYMNAVMHCPLEVLNNEANPAVFIEFEDNDVWAAAKRLVKYWEWRVLLFDEIDMAYESILNISVGDDSKRNATTTTSVVKYGLTSSQRDCMRDEFCRLVRDKGMIVVQTTHSNSNFLLIFDPERFHVPIVELGTHANLLHLLRLLLYSFTVMINNISTSKENEYFFARTHRRDPFFGSSNYALINNTKNTRNTKKYTFASINVIDGMIANMNSFARNGYDMIHEAIPLVFVETHTAYIPQKLSSKWKIFIQGVAESINSIASAVLKDYVTKHVSHLCDYKHKIIQRLLPHGIKNEMLPTTLGGTLDYNSEEVVLGRKQSFGGGRNLQTANKRKFTADSTLGKECFGNQLTTESVANAMIHQSSLLCQAFTTNDSERQTPEDPSLAKNAEHNMIIPPSSSKKYGSVFNFNDFSDYGSIHIPNNVTTLPHPQNPIIATTSAVVGAVSFDPNIPVLTAPSSTVNNNVIEESESKQTLLLSLARSKQHAIINYWREKAVSAPRNKKKRKDEK